MLTYLVLLLAASLALAALYFFLGKSIPIEPPVYYLSIGFSLVLSLVLPYFLASLNALGVLTIYILLILLFSLVLTMAREKLVLKRQGRIPADPENRYIGKKVGLFTGENQPPAAAFAKVLADHLAALVPRRERPESPAGEKDVTGDAVPATFRLDEWLEEETPQPLVSRAADPLPGEGRDAVPMAAGEEPEPGGLFAPREDHPAPEGCFPPAASSQAEDPGEGPAAATENPAEYGEQPVPQAPTPEAPGPAVPPEQGYPGQAPPPDPLTQGTRLGGYRPAQPKDRGYYAAALRSLFHALEQRPPVEVKARLTLQMSEVYRELGQYWQAVEVVRMFLLSAGAPADGEILNALIVNAAYCQAILKTLREERLTPVPYADLAEEARTRATKLAGKLILEGGWQGEEIAGDH